MTTPRMGMAQAKLEQTKEFILQHPSAKDYEIVDALRVSRRTIAYAKAELVLKGLIPAPRKTARKEPAPVPPVLPPVPAPDYSDSLVTPANIMALAADPFDDDLESDPETQKRMTRAAKKMAFDPKNHPDIQMAAMQLWMKLKDAARARELGPGKPMTYEAAKARGMPLFKAMGLKLVIDIIETLWGNQKETPDAPNVETPAPVGIEEAPSSAGHEGSEAPTEDLRPVDLGTGPAPAADNDLPGPTA